MSFEKTFESAGRRLTLSDDATRIDVDRVYAWLAASYWAPDRDRPTIERSLANSYPYGVYDGDTQVALTRVTSDLASFAWIGDVVVDAPWRGRGVGTWMVGEVVSHLRSLGVPRLVLATRDAHEVYAKLGFTPLRVPATWMEIDTRAHRPEPGDVRSPG